MMSQNTFSNNNYERQPNANGGYESGRLMSVSQLSTSALAPHLVDYTNPNNAPQASHAPHPPSTAPHHLTNQNQIDGQPFGGLCGVEIDPFQFGGGGSVVGGSDAALPFAVGGGPIAAGESAPQINGRYSRSGGPQPAVGGGGSLYAGRIGGQGTTMTLRQSMAALGNDQPGRIGSTFAAEAAAHFASSNTHNNNNSAGRGSPPARLLQPPPPLPLLDHNSTYATASAQNSTYGCEGGTPRHSQPTHEQWPAASGGMGGGASLEGRYGVLTPGSEGAASLSPLQTSTSPIDNAASSTAAGAEAFMDAAAYAYPASCGGEAAVGSIDVEPFLLPTMPKKVECLVFSLLSNWGDSYYVGLSGIEVFDGEGRRIVPSSQPSASSSSSARRRPSSDVSFTIHSTFDIIAKLGGAAFGALDLRASCIAGASNLSNVSQLVNGHYKKTTTDANEMFRMPVNFAEAAGFGALLGSGGGGVGIGSFNPSTTSSNNNALIWINFSKPVDISLIRIYNYNVGREQAFKGVQLMEIISAPLSSSSSSATSARNEAAGQQQQQQQQQELLFRGEIAMASGDRFNEPEQILFVPTVQSTSEGGVSEGGASHASAAAIKILSRIVEEDANMANQLATEDPLMKVRETSVEEERAATEDGNGVVPFPTTAPANIGNPPSFSATPSPPIHHSATAPQGHHGNSCANPQQQQQALALPIATSYHQKQALQRVGSAGGSSNAALSSSRGGSGGGAYEGSPSGRIGASTSNNSPPHPSSTGGGSTGGVCGPQPPPPAIRVGGGVAPPPQRITSASAAGSLLRQSLAAANSNNSVSGSGGHTSSFQPVGSNNGNGSKTVSFASEGLSDKSSSAAKAGAKARPHPAASDPTTCPRDVTGVCIGVQSTWGDDHFVGLSGLRFFTTSGEAVFNIVQMSVARPPSTATGITAAEMAALSAYDSETAALADGDPSTACAWRFQEQMQIRVRFDPPVPSLGFIEIANYGISGSTHCGLKAAQVFVATANMSSPNALFDQLWSSPALPPGVVMLTAPNVPLIVRKSPNQLTLLKHQSFDLSGSVGAGGGGGMVGTVSLTTSMTASMAARAKIEMKRARMALFDGPPPQSQIPHGVACATCVLPQGYVVKLELGLAITVPMGADLKPLLKQIINEAMGGGAGSGNSTNGAITLFDEDCAPIAKDMYSIAVTLRHEEKILIANHNSSGVFLPPAGAVLTTAGGEAAGLGYSKGEDMTASIVIDRGLREAMVVSQQLGNASAPSSPSALQPQERHLISLSFAFVFDIPTAISAISHNFRSLKSAQGRISSKAGGGGLFGGGGSGGGGLLARSSCTVRNVKVHVDDEPTYESLEFDLESIVAAQLAGEEADDLADTSEPPPRCVVFVWDPRLIAKF